MNYPNPKEAFSAYQLIMSRVTQIGEQMNHIFQDNNPSDIKDLERVEEQLIHDIQAMHFTLESMENVIMMRRNSQAILANMLEAVSPNPEDTDNEAVDETQESLPSENVSENSVEENPVEENNEETVPETTMADLLEEEEQEQEQQELVSNSRAYKFIDGEKVFRFYRRVYNGFILMAGMKTNTQDHKYFIPEKMIGDMGVDEGDYLAVTDSYVYNGRQYYKFEIREKNPGGQMDRLQYEYCLVHEDVSPIAPSPFYVDTSFTKGALMEYKNGEYLPLYRLYLSEQDIKRHQIKTDDVLTVAYWVNQPQESVRVIEINEVGGDDNTTSTKSNTTAKKKASTKKADVEVDTTTYPNIVGKTICVVGFEHFHSRYEKVLASFGANTETLIGEEKSVTQFASAIDNADVVVFVVEMMSHLSYNEIKAYAKSKEVPHIIATKSGATFVAKMANDRLSDDV